MNWFRNLFTPTGTFPIRQREVTSKPTGTIGVPASTTDTTDYSKQTEQSGSYEENIVSVLSPRAALTISAVYRAIELRAKTIGQMQMQYQVKDSAGGNFTPSMYGKGRDLNYMLQVEPNPIMSAASLWEQVTIDRLQRGNGFVYIERDYDGVPLALWLAICGGYNMALGTYNIAYLGEHGIVEKASVPKSDILHFPNTFRDQNGFWGIPTLRYALETMSLIKTQKKQALENAAKGGRVKLLIGEDKPAQGQGTLAFGMFNKDQMNSYAKEINRDIYAQDVVALRGLQNVHNISMTAADMQMIELLNMGQDDVARFYATPRPLLMLDTNSHYNDYSNATMEYLQRTIAPDAREIEDECNRKFLNVYDFGKRRFHLCELPLLRMDLERQAKVDQLHLQMGWTVNEIRNQYDMPAIEKGDIPYVSTNLAELGSDKLRSNGSGRPSSDNNDGEAAVAQQQTQ